MNGPHHSIYRQYSRFLTAGWQIFTGCLPYSRLQPAHNPTYYTMSPKVLLTAIFLFVACLHGYGQGSQLTGLVLNTDSIPIADATVIAQKADSSFVDATVTDAQGRFSLKIPTGAYRLLFRHLNYFNLSIESRSGFTGTAVMQENTNLLQEVTVKAEKPRLKVENGLLSYDLKALAPNSIHSNAFDVLKDIPLIDSDENSLKLNGGMGETSIIINGKLSAMSLSQLYTYLKSLPPEKLEKVEITYNAPPQWHVRGNAINVIVKQTTRYELQGMVQGKWLNQHANSYSGTGSLFASNKTFSYDLIYNYGNNHSLSQNDVKARHTVGEEVYDVRSTDRSTGKSQSHSLYGNIGYTSPRKHALNLSYSGLMTPRIDNRSSATSNLFSDTRARDGGDSYLHDVQLAYNAPFGLRITGEYTRYRNNMLQDMTYLRKEGNTEEAFRYDREQQVSQYSATADMGHQLAHGWGLNYGMRYSHSTNDNRQSYDDRANGGADSYSSSSTTEEDIANAYIGMNKSFWDGKLYVNLSLSAEYSRMNDYKRTDFIPNATVSYRISPKHTLQLAYNSYNWYPSYWEKQDYETHLNEYTTSYGNPQLRPARYDILNLMYVFNNKYVARLSYYRIDNFMVAQSYQSPDELQLIYKTVNLDFTSNLMAMLVIPVQIGKVLSSNLTLTAYNERYKSNDWFGIAYDRNKWAGLFSVYNNIRISQKPDISVNIKAFYRTPTLFGIYDYTDNWGVDAGIKWQFAKEKAVLSFQCYDIFEKTYANMRVNYAKQVQDFDSQKYKRIFALTFTYKFNDYKRGGRGVDTSRFGTR